ncbi:uncharacterized protein [Nicotiana tomentosiformis]|uniref:uncharacterized protein n=1 Tax=Nicotiana tomentosiformis TaxID=4098 RepID=UPI00388C499E
MGDFGIGHSPRPFHLALQTSHSSSASHGPYVPYYGQPAYIAPSPPIARPEAESSDVVIIGIILVFHRDASILFDLGSTYSYVSYYFSVYHVVPRDSLGAHVYVFMPAGDSIIVDRVYRSYVVTIGSLETSVDILLPDMIDFNVILGMDWPSPYHMILDCHTKTVTLAMLGLPRLEWRGTLGHSTSKVISYVKARHMVEKRCLAYLDYARDSSAEVLSTDSIPIVREFPEVFPTDLPGMPADRDINFCIDLDPGTQPIFILPYYMAPPELKELLQDFLDKGFIRPSVSPGGAPVLFVRRMMGQ